MLERLGVRGVDVGDERDCIRLLEQIASGGFLDQTERNGLILGNRFVV